MTKELSFEQIQTTFLEFFLIQSTRSSLDQSKENSNNSNNQMTSNNVVISLEECILLEENVNEIQIETIDDNSSPSSIPSSRILTD
jgi:hypothetical protein